jgi:hypothetical protein
MVATHSVNNLAYIVLIAFAPAASLLFLYLSIQRAVLVTVIGGFLFLPVFEIPMLGLPDYSKYTAISMALILGPLVSGQRLPRVTKLRWWDIAYALWVVALPISYLANDFPIYNALSALFKKVMMWGVPFWVGRSCFQSAASARLLIQSIVIGGLINVPLAAWEIRMSPQLHTTLYGQFQHSFGQMMRDGGFRPIVFTEHALVLALWFGITLIAATALRKSGRHAPIWVQKSWWILPCFITILPMCKSMGAIILGFSATASVAFRWCRPAIPAMLATAVVYIGARILFDDFTYQATLQLLEYLPPERAHSFQFRMDNESTLLAHAWKQPWLGWVNEGFRKVIVDGVLLTDSGAEIITDSLWIIVFGTTGLWGLITLYSVLLASATRHCWDASARHLVEAQVLSTIVAVLLLDTIANGWFGPVATLCTGAALSVGSAKKTGLSPSRSTQKKTTRLLQPGARIVGAVDHSSPHGGPSYRPPIEIKRIT